jgi:hypothetical protein
LLVEQREDPLKVHADLRRAANGADGAAERPAAAGLPEGVAMAAAGDPRTGS